MKDILMDHFPNGFRIDSQIELNRFRRFALEYYGKKLAISDEKLRDRIIKTGILFESKAYIVTGKTNEKIRRSVFLAFESSNNLIFYNVFFDQNENWLINEGIVSADMLKEIIRNICPEYEHKQSYFSIDGSMTVESEIANCFDQSILINYKQLSDMLPYIPIDVIKRVLSQNDDFIWNSVGTYTHIKRFEITEEEKQTIKTYAVEQQKTDGYLSLADVPIDEISERNFELSVTAIHNAIFSKCLDGEYERHGKIVTHKGIELNAFEITKQYCRTLEKCSLEELLAFEKELTGEIHHWISIGAAYAEMVRIDAATFVSQKKVKFDVETIDAILEDFCPGDYIPLLSVTTMAAFPHVRQPWTHFMLESYVRLFSYKYRFEVLSVNSRNCGAIVRKSCELDYPAIMIDAVAKSAVILNKREVLEFLYVNGYIGKRSWSGVDTLLKQAKKIRESRH